MKSRIKQVLTKEGFNEFKKEQEELLELRKGAVKNLAQARELGDLSENGFYKAAKSELRRIDGRLTFLSYLLKTAEVITSHSSNIVSVGSTVVVAGSEGQKTFHIVGSYESDPRLGKISQNSPIGRALFGKRTGESVSIVVPSGVTQFKIVEIS